MLYPVQNLDRFPWWIVGAPIRPQFARDLVFDSMDRQNALECHTGRDLPSMAIQTRFDSTKRPTSQFGPTPGLFPQVLSIPILGSRNRPIAGSDMLHSRAIPIHSPDLDYHAGDPKARSDTSKPLKKYPPVSKSRLIMRTQYQKGPVFGSGA